MYKPRNGWTKEQMINAVKLGNKDSRSIDGHRCVYRSDDGNKCFVGVFIPDDVYDDRIENSGCGGSLNADILFKDYPGLRHYMPLKVEGMVAFQRVHDRALVGGLHALAVNWILWNVED